MQSIPQLLSFKKSIESISLQLHTLTSTLNLLEFLKEIPGSILSSLMNPELLESVNILESYLNDLNELLSPINQKIKKHLNTTKFNSDKTESYAGFKVDEKPIKGKEMNDKKTNEKLKSSLPFEEINLQYRELHGKDIKPIKRHEELKYKGNCPYCGAPNDYIYNNNNGDQCKCKACKNTFSYKTKFYDELAFYCPHCGNKLELFKDRSSYYVYRCHNYKCSFYLKNKAKTSDNEKRHYTYRAFKFTLDDVNSNGMIDFDTEIDLNNAHHSPQVIGTVITYYVNYGLSTRKTALIMKEIHGIQISHQTVSNYAEAVASFVQNLTTNYKYQLSNTLVGDETYIKVLGDSHYVFFFSDPDSKVITSWKIYEKRDTRSATESLLMSFNKYESIPEDILVITDGNPIYNAAQLFLSMYDINFNLQQVIGVSNKDEVSIKYRPYKQIEERLNRTYKQNYYGTHGYKSLLSANIYMVLFVTFFNFLRGHSTLKYKTPVILPELEEITLMPDKWVYLINLSKKYIN